jgi:hypothetical protein
MTPAMTIKTTTIAMMIGTGLVADVAFMECAS